MIGIYKITNPIGQIYIGQSKDIEKRFKQHKNEFMMTKLKFSFLSYGYENHSFEVVEECEKSELNNRERYWQEHFKTIGFCGLNVMLAFGNDKQCVGSYQRKYWKKIKPYNTTKT